jgi:hypothetical protein
MELVGEVTRNVTVSLAVNDRGYGETKHAYRSSRRR